MKDKIQKLITRDGKVNVQATRSKKILTPELKLEIEQYTIHLNSVNPTIGQRIKAIILNVLQIKYCECNKPCKLSGYKDQMFNSTCGNKTCISNLNTYEHNNEWKTKFNTTRQHRKKTRINGLMQYYSNANFIDIDINLLLEFISNRFNTPDNIALVLPEMFKTNRDILCNILSHTKFIKIIGDDFKWSERFYCILNNITTVSTCKCGAKLLFYNYKSGYSTVCNKCKFDVASIIRAKNSVINKCNEIMLLNEYDILACPLGLNSGPFILEHRTCKTKIIQYMHNGKRGKTIRCQTCDPKYSLENEVFKFINSYDINPVHSSRSIIPPYELDIVISEKNLAIEFNGNYWHGQRQNTQPSYHLNKTILTNQAGYQLIHIFEDEWINKEKIVKNRLKSILHLNKYKVYARKCEVKEIDSKTKSKFLNKYHIQGNDNSTIKLGLFYKNKLVAIQTFGKRRFDKKEGFELIRFCTIGGFTIIGAAGKLLKYFERKYKPVSIISYADRRWSEGNLYKQLGFTHTHNSKPNYFYMYKENLLFRESRIKYQKHKLKDMLLNFDQELSEWQNMKNNDYDRIWDCGNMVFVK